jgi:hypothetical protein
VVPAEAQAVSGVEAAEAVQAVKPLECPVAVPENLPAVAAAEEKLYPAVAGLLRVVVVMRQIPEALAAGRQELPASRRLPAER